MNTYRRGRVSHLDVVVIVLVVVQVTIDGGGFLFFGVRDDFDGGLVAGRRLGFTRLLWKEVREEN